MAITIFLALNGLAAAFLLYVLANFWKEGRRAKKISRPSADGEAWAKVVVVTHPVSHAAHGGMAVVPIPVRDWEWVEPLGRSLAERPRTAVRRISTR